MFSVNGKCSHGGYSKKNGEIKAGNTDFAAMLDDKAEEVRDGFVEEKAFSFCQANCSAMLEQRLQTMRIKQCTHLSRRKRCNEGYRSIYR